MTTYNNISIIGAGESGLGAAILAKHKQINVFVSDHGQIAPKYRNELENNKIDFEEGGHTLDKIIASDLIVVSPGIPKKSDIIKKIKAAGIPLISEIEFAYHFIKDEKIIAITGSNGKTTTTSLLYFILKNAGLNVAYGGNIGYSFARALVENPSEYYVLELSSFQLDDIKSFKPDIAILLNITADHLNRYDYKIENYAKAKFKIIQNQSTEDYFIYCADDEHIKQQLGKKEMKMKMLPFSIFNQIEEGAHLQNQNELIINVNKNNLSMTIYELGLQGKHNVYNSMAAGIVGKVLNLRKESIRKSLQDFEGIEHRLESVATVSGVEFINDSKATNVNSTWFALETIKKDIVWIAGGVDKGNEYEFLQNLVQEKVKVIICLGKEINKLHQNFSNMVDVIINTMSMQEAVDIAYHFAEKDDKVLLSPACASFDLFENYEDRGNQFKSLVKNL